MQQQERLHALDAVRSFALLLGIVFHATFSFLPTYERLGWFFVDNSPSTTLGVTYSVIHIFRMTTFFVMAGFFARLVIYRRGQKGFVKDRTKRILVPLLVAWPIVVALIGLATLWAASVTGKPLVAPATSVPAALPFAWTHLWFLYVLLLLYALTLLIRWFANTVVDRSGGLRRALDGSLGWTTRMQIAPLLLALPGALALILSPSWKAAWAGIPTPDNSLIPNLPAMVAYGTAFAFGWFLHRQVDLLQRLQRFWPWFFAVAVILTVICLSLGGTPGVARPPVLTGQDRAIYAVCYCVAAWLWTFAIIGAALRFLSGESTVRRYLADSSYWLYIFHMPLVLGLQVVVSRWPIHWSIKFIFIVGVTVGLLLLSYRYWVRPTYIGEILNGRRYPRREQSAQGVESGLAVEDAGATSLASNQRSG